MLSCVPVPPHASPNIDLSTSLSGMGSSLMAPQTKLLMTTLRRSASWVLLPLSLKSALARIYNVGILVVSAADSFTPMVFHTSQTKRMIVLWLQDKHLELLKPTAEEATCKDYPAEHWQVTDAPVKGIRAGGKAASSAPSSSLRSGTVITKASKVLRFLLTVSRQARVARSLSAKLSRRSARQSAAGWVQSGTKFTAPSELQGRPATILS